MFDLSDYFARNNVRINSHLQALLDRHCSDGRLAAAMRYSLMAGGKRLRPILCLAAAEACGGNPEDALPLACSLEMIHGYSLIHDDLPAMDDDELRRGQPTCHVAFDEATAILAGDALLTLAFEIIVSADACAPPRRIEIIRLVSAAAGCRGMVQGQMLDMQSEGRPLGLQELQHLHQLKTGAMIEASLVSGAIAAGGGAAQIEAVRDYGRSLGLAFQIVDDILNVEGDPARMGKSAGTDRQRGKNAFPALVGLEESKKRAQDLAAAALSAIAGFDSQADALRAIARFVVERRT